MIELHFASLVVGFVTGIVAVLAIVGSAFIEKYANKNDK